MSECPFRGTLLFSTQKGTRDLYYEYGGTEKPQTWEQEVQRREGWGTELKVRGILHTESQFPLSTQDGESAQGEMGRQATGIQQEKKKKKKGVWTLYISQI